MTNKLNDGREPDPEQDKADEAISPIEACTTCRGPIDEDGDCIDDTCPACPDYLDDDEPEEGLLGEDDDDA